jgi:NADH-quinone oxidoreductase subunit N
MNTNLQQYIITIIDSIKSRPNFDLSLHSKSQLLFDVINISAARLEGGHLWTLLVSEVILFGGVIYLLVFLGLSYNVLDHKKLFLSLVKRAKSISYFGLAGVVFSIINMFKMSNIDWFKGLSILNASYKIDIFTQSSKLCALLIVLFLFAFLSLAINNNFNSAVIELPILLNIAISLSFIMISCGNFALLLLALEGFSLILYILTTVERAYGGITAAVKYFAFGTLGSVFLFWGVVHLYAIVPSLSYKVIFFLTDFSSTFKFLEGYDYNAIEFATTAITMGFLIKLGAAPLHQWVPDVYAGSHVFITALFATFVKFILFVLFIRIAYFTNNGIFVDFAILISLFLGCYMTLKQTEIKRFLAYSSIVHVSFLLMGDFSASFTYLATYMLSSLLIFSVLMSVRINGKELIYLNDLRFIRQSGLQNTILVIVSLASAAGLPPFAGFYGKFAVWVSLFEDVYLFNNIVSYVILLSSIILSLAIIFYYMRIIAYLFISDDSQLSVNFLFSSAQPVVMFAEAERIYLVQIVYSVLLIFWTALHSSFLNFVELISFSIVTAWQVV